jgi:O-antigen ligase
MRGQPAPGFDDASRTWRGRLEESAALLAPVALIVPLALAGGGYDLGDRHIAGLAIWLVVVGLLVLGVASGASRGRPLYRSAGLIFGLALLSAFSSFWSGSAELSAIEADRVLVYLGMFLAAFLIAQTDKRGQRFAEGLTIAVAAVALLGLASRLLPDVLQFANSLGSGARLRYPLGYWNANGAMFGIAAGLLLWTARGAASAWLRWASVAALPAVLLGLYFSFSRGGLLALVVCAGCLIALSADRLWHLGTLAIAAIAVLPALLAAQSRTALTDNADLQATVDQGLTVLLILLAGIALGLLLFAGLRRLEARQGARTGRLVELSRDRRLLRGAALAGALLAIGATIAVGGRAWDQFSDPDIQFPSDPAQHFGDLSGAGRHDFYSVATESFGEEPLRGVGAGAYEFAWERHRSLEQPVHDAHSLYLEAFAELGLAGGLLVLALVGTLLWTAFAAWRAARGRGRELHAALLAAMLAFAVTAGLDWFWEIAALGAVFFLAAGAAVAARCRQLAAGAPGRDEAAEDSGRFRLTVAGLAVAWLTAIALIGPLLVEREVGASRDAAAAGEIASAVDHAETARSIEPWAASPYVQLGLLAELQGDYATASQRLTQAIDREDRNWQYYYLRSKVEAAAGNAAAARADLAEARRLNPLEECLRGNPSCG